jgi:hypothetical protein
MLSESIFLGLQCKHLQSLADLAEPFIIAVDPINLHILK